MSRTEDKTKLICPVCGKEFTASDDTKYIAGGGFTCDWKCFLDHIKNASVKKEKKSRNCK